MTTTAPLGNAASIRIRGVAPWRRLFPRRWIARTAVMLADLLALVAGMALGLVASNFIGKGRLGDPADHHVLLFAASLPAWLLIFSHYGLYTTRYVRSRLEEFRRIFHAVGAGALATAFCGFMLQLYASRVWLAFSFLFGLCLVTIERELMRQGFAALRRRGRMLRPVVLVGGNDEGLALCTTLMDDASLGYRVVGFVDDLDTGESVVDDRGPILGTTAQTLEAVRRTGAAGVVVATTSVGFETSNRLTRELTEAGVHVELSLALRDVVPERLVVRPLGRFPVVYVEPAVRHGWPAAAKRTLDLTVATTALVAMAPVLLMIAVAVRLGSPGPVIFRQTRVGKDGKPFDVLKFRTMVQGAERLVADLRDDNEAGGPLFKLEVDPRITRTGRWLRRTSLDELPQLWNVIKGEMSLVGPRPALASEMADWTPELHGRLRVKPGITGMWQVSRKPDWSFEDYVRHDLHYVDNWSLLTDIAIGLKTIPIMLFSRNNK